MARPWIVGVSILVLDALGAVYSWRAARTSPTGPAPWGLIGAGHAASVLTTVALVAARLSMFVLITAGVFAAGVRQFTGRARFALFTEVGVVLSAGFMVTWYFALEPVFEHQSASVGWLTSVGWPLGDLLLLAAVASVVLRGAVGRFASPISISAAGLAVYFAADVAWSAIDATGRLPASSPAAGLSIVIATLLLTVAPIYAAAGRNRPYHGGPAAHRPGRRTCRWPRC